MYKAIKHIYPNIEYSQFQLQDDGEGAYIKQWDYSEPQPTQTQIDAAQVEVVKAKSLRDCDISIELYLDGKARSAGFYDPLERIPPIDRACAYAGYDNPSRAHSEKFVSWRGRVWAYVYAELAKVESGQRDIPAEGQLEAELDANVPFDI